MIPVFADEWMIYEYAVGMSFRPISPSFRAISLSFWPISQVIPTD